MLKLDKLKTKVHFALWLPLLVFVLQFFVGLTMYSFFPSDNSNQFSVIFFVQTIAVLLPCVMYALFSEKEPQELFRIRRLDRTTVFMCAALGIAAQIIAPFLDVPLRFILTLLFGALPQSSLSAPATFGGLIAGLFVVALLPAICEEFLMRGIVLTEAEKNGAEYAIVLSAVYFALLHNDIGSITAFLFLGALFGLVTIFCGSIIAGMVVHFSSNTLGLVLHYISDQNHLMQSVFSRPEFLYCAMFFALPTIFILLDRFSSKYEGNPLSIKNIDKPIINVPIIVLVVSLILSILF